MDTQYFLYLIDEFERILGLAIHLIYKCKDRYTSHHTDLEQLDSLRLHTLGSIDDHHCGVSRHQCTVGVLREILVSRRVQNIYTIIIVVELQNRRCYGDSTLLLYLHPVGNRMLGSFSALDRSCQIDRSAVEQELLGQSRFTCIRV